MAGMFSSWQAFKDAGLEEVRPGELHIGDEFSESFCSVTKEGDRLRLMFVIEDDEAQLHAEGEFPADVSSFYYWAALLARMTVHDRTRVRHCRGKLMVDDDNDFMDIIDYGFEHLDELAPESDEDPLLSLATPQRGGGDMDDIGSMIVALKNRIAEKGKLSGACQVEGLLKDCDSILGKWRSAIGGDNETMPEPPKSKQKPADLVLSNGYSEQDLFAQPCNQELPKKPKCLPFGKEDERLKSWTEGTVRSFVKQVFPELIASGKLKGKAVEFLRTWTSGVCFQAKGKPVLLPGKGDDSDIVLHGHKVFYFKDVVIEYEGCKYRLLKSFQQKSAPYILNWLVEQGVPVAGYVDESRTFEEVVWENDDYTPIGKDDPVFDDSVSPIIPGRAVERSLFDFSPCRELSIEERAAADLKMASVPRLGDGTSIAAKQVKTELNKQMRAHGYTPSKLARGADIERRLVVWWSRGEGVIHKDELEKLCRHMGIVTLFDGL